jgi:hypothetical protein
VNPFVEEQGLQKRPTSNEQQDLTVQEAPLSPSVRAFGLPIRDDRIHDSLHRVRVETEGTEGAQTLPNAAQDPNSGRKSATDWLQSLNTRRPSAVGR